MIKTFFGCYFTEIKVNPSNWNDKSASTDLLKKDWYIYYRYYDPTITDAAGKIKPLLVIGKGMNKYKNLKARREATETILATEMKHLTISGYNPITAQYMVEHEDAFEGDIDPETPLLEAYDKALSLIECGHRTRIGIKSVLKGISKVARQLRVHDMPVSKIGRKHIKKILQQCELTYKLSAYRYNTYRGYLNMIYNEMVEQEAVTGNPVRDISKKVITKKIKPVLTDDERKRIKEHLREVFPKFAMFVPLFFHSGGRKTELLQLKPCMVDLQAQKYRCIIKKRKKYIEVERTIKDVALPYWKFFIEYCPDDCFLFGERFEPRTRPMGIDMPTLYWKEYVKKGLGIKVDFYSLKHLNTTETVDYFENKQEVVNPEAMAAAQNAHTSEAMVISIYDVKQRDRQHLRLKQVSNEF